jgi:colicin import membrane protein
MKKFAAACFLATAGVLAGAQPAVQQPAAPAEAPRSIDAERARINAERARLEAGFLAEDAECYKKFAVNSCLGKVNERRREVMGDLRRQEILLNDEERRIRGAEQIRKTEEKASPENQQEAADRRAKAAADYQSRLEREKKKNEDRAAAKAAEQGNSDASAARLKGSQEKSQTKADKQATAAAEAKKYNDRVKEAQERKAQHESERLKQTKPPAKSLPLPQD